MCILGSKVKQEVVGVKVFLAVAVLTKSRKPPKSKDGKGLVQLAGNRGVALFTFAMLMAAILESKCLHGCQK